MLSSDMFQSQKRIVVIIVTKTTGFGSLLVFNLKMMFQEIFVLEPPRTEAAEDSSVKTMSLFQVVQQQRLGLERLLLAALLTTVLHLDLPLGSSPLLLLLLQTLLLVMRDQSDTLRLLSFILVQPLVRAHHFSSLSLTRGRLDLSPQLLPHILLLKRGDAWLREWTRGSRIESEACRL